MVRSPSMTFAMYVPRIGVIDQDGEAEADEGEEIADGHAQKSSGRRRAHRR